jgi:hypothetical protein
MIARVTTAQGRPGQIDDITLFFQEIGIPSCLGVAGFRAAYLLVDRATAKWVEVSVWESKEADEQAMAAGAQRLEGNERAQMLGADIHTGVISSDYYEVAVESSAKPV